MQRRKAWRDRGKARLTSGAATTDPDRRPLWTEHEAAEYFNVPVQTIRNNRSTGTGAFGRLPYVKFDRMIRYEPAACEAYAAARRRCAAHEAPEADEKRAHCSL
jgi:hypothetical protein